jgi:hypothetical protein
VDKEGHHSLPPLPKALSVVPRDWQKRGFAALREYGKLTARWRPLPDFLIVGAKRTGTTTLWKALEKHPGMASMWPRFAKIKSPHYFDLRFERGIDWYRGHFPMELPGRSRKILGEADPYCLFHPLVPARVAETVPDMRLIALLRDPIDRAVSHHWDRVREGIEPLTELADAIEAEPGRVAGKRDAILRGEVLADDDYEHFSYVTRGMYAEQLRHWLDYFPAEQLLVARSEDLYRDPQAVYDRVCEHVGLARNEPEEFVRWHTRADKPKVDPVLRDRLARHFAPANEELAELLGTSVWWDVDGPTELGEVAVAKPRADRAAAPAIR